MLSLSKVDLSKVGLETTWRGSRCTERSVCGCEGLEYMSDVGVLEEMRVYCEGVR